MSTYTVRLIPRFDEGSLSFAWELRTGKGEPIRSGQASYKEDALKDAEAYAQAYEESLTFGDTQDVEIEVTAKGIPPKPTDVGEVEVLVDPIV